VVFGGNIKSGTGTVFEYETLEIFNGTDWTMENLNFAIGPPAMVQLPCPQAS
jgi:hypothetical protein